MGLEVKFRPLQPNQGMALQSLLGCFGCPLGLSLGFGFRSHLRGPHLGLDSRPPTFRSRTGSRTKGMFFKI